VDVKRRLFVLLFVNVIALSLAASALAAGGTVLSGYGGLAGVAQSKVVQPGGGLPFTGLNLALIAAGAVALIVTGFTLRRSLRAR
jgi:hypothetical protein